MDRVVGLIKQDYISDHKGKTKVLSRDNMTCSPYILVCFLYLYFKTVFSIKVIHLDMQYIDSCYQELICLDKEDHNIVLEIQLFYFYLF